MDILDLNWFKNNWKDVFLILVGLSAIVVYFFQERRKKSEAASLIIMQVEDLERRINDIGSYIVDGKLNETAFYESNILLNIDYWNKYKHYFIKEIDAVDFGVFDSFYSYALEITEQQQLMKNFQKNFLFLTQQTLINMENTFIMQGLTLSEKTPIEQDQLMELLKNIVPPNIDKKNINILENLLKRMIGSNLNIDMNTFWNIYNKKREYSYYYKSKCFIPIYTSTNQNYS